jgi:recombination protein RecR
MSFSPLLAELIEALRCLPGVGPKSAQRMALHLLDRQRDGAGNLAETLTKALEQVGRCQSCRTLCETAHCQICTAGVRDASLLCVVASPIDILAIEQSGHFNGKYFVLNGLLSPLDGIGPETLKLDEFNQRIADAQVQEIILALSPTVEGEATVQYLMSLAREQSKPISRIAFGVPFGGELEYVDSHTLSHALSSRQLL